MPDPTPLPTPYPPPHVLAVRAGADGNHRFAANDSLQILNTTSGLFHTLRVKLAGGAPALHIADTGEA